MPLSGEFTHKLNLVRLHSQNCMPESCVWKKKKMLKDLGHFSAIPQRASACWMTYMMDLQWVASDKSMQQNDRRTLFHVIMEIPDSWDINTLMISAGCQKHRRAFFFYGRLLQVLQSKVMDVE